MSAYFQTQIIKSEEMVTTLRCSFSDFLKYLSINNSDCNHINQEIAKQAPVRVATVCSYDKGALKYRYDSKIAVYFAYYTTKKSGVEKGVFINHEKKQFVNYSTIIERAEKLGYVLFDESEGKEFCLIDWVLNPLSLLTRKTRETMGGGDVDFQKLPHKTRELTSTWYNNVIDYQEDEDGLANYEDLSLHFVCTAY